MQEVIAMFDAGITLAIVLLAIVAIYLWHRVFRGIRVFARFRKTRQVTCPETHEAAAVQVAALRMGREAILGEPRLRLSECSRWPMRVVCGQDCLRQIEARESELRFLSRLKHSAYSPERT
jgi:hypothetical protein